MRPAWGLIAVAAIVGEASAQSAPLIDAFDQMRMREIAVATGFPLSTQAGTKWSVPQDKPLILPNGETLKPGTEIRMAGAFDQFQGPDGLTFSVLPSPQGLLLKAILPLPKGIDVNAFLEVFNNTNPTVKLYLRGGSLICDRYVQLSGGVTEANLRDGIRSYVAAASTLMGARRN